MSWDAVYFSPHLDDAVFSCGARLLVDAQAGRRLLVVSLFTAGDASYRARIEEDRQALSKLGVEGRRIDLVDAPFRSARYRSFAGLTQGWDRTDRITLDRAMRLVRAVLRETRPKTVFAPLGVGGHIDHRLTHEAVRRVDSAGRVFYYEDRPYALPREAVALRLAEISWAAQPAPLRGGGGKEPVDRPLRERAHDFFGDFFQAPYVQCYLRRRTERLRVMGRYGWLLARPPAPTRQVDRVDCDWDASVLDGVQAVIACYASQLNFFGGLAGWRAQCLAYHERLGFPNRYVERYWSYPQILRVPGSGIGMD